MRGEESIDLVGWSEQIVLPGDHHKVRGTVLRKGILHREPLRLYQAEGGLRAVMAREEVDVQ